MGWNSWNTFGPDIGASVVLGLIENRACRVRDVWRGEELGVFSGSFTTRVDRHDVTLVTLTPLR